MVAERRSRSTTVSLKSKTHLPRFALFQFVLKRCKTGTALCNYLKISLTKYASHKISVISQSAPMITKLLN
jgi:hypothetical protein